MSLRSLSTIMCVSVPRQAAAPPIDRAATEDVSDGSHDARSPCATVLCDSEVLHCALLRIWRSNLKELGGLGWGTRIRT
jgi:hypothetical protein